MKEALWRLPVARGWNCMQRGIAEGILVTLVPIAPVAVMLGRFDAEPREQLLLGLAGVGATLLVAYAVVVAWLVGATRHRSRTERENRLGAFLGVGISGFIGILFSLGLSEQAAAGHWSWLDCVAFAWAVVSVFMLGMFVVMQPWVVHEWIDNRPPRRPMRLPRAPIRHRRF